MIQQPDGASGCGTGMRVLIADDDPRAREALKALLAAVELDMPNGAAMSMQVVGEAANGQEAVQLAADCQPDVVLIDARMPRMDGCEAARRIKGQTPWVKVVMLSMHPAYQDEAKAAGVDTFLIKGCPLEQLLEAIFTQLPSCCKGDACRQE